MRIEAAVALAAAVVLAACSTNTAEPGTGATGGNNSACTPSATNVCMSNNLFDPASVTINRGAVVSWQNVDAVTHTSTSNPANPTGCPTWDNTLAGGASGASVAFNPTTAVTCEYYCRIHATPTTGAMRATVIVQ